MPSRLDIVASQLMGALLSGQGESISIAERYADRIDERLGMRWLEIVRLLRTSSGDLNLDQVRARQQIQALIHEIEREVNDGLTATASSARRTTSRAFLETLPQELLENQVVGGLLEAETPKRRLKKRTTNPLTEVELRKIITRGGYAQRLRRWASRLTRADKVARILAEGLAQDLDPNEIARRIAPFVKEYADAAKRLLRTESSRIHNEVLERTFEQYDDLIVGYQIIGILDDRIRPHHATRHGKIWYTHKAPHASDRPQLPDEPNCRCTYTVLLRDGLRRPGVPIPSSRTYHAWFDRQTIATKQKIVGKRRWKEVKSKISRPSWNDFINPSSGRLIKLETLERKTPAQIRRTREQINSRQKKQAEFARGFK
jgi:SPP1 gp7 family putative phage head morphogenesis protein